VSGEDLYKNWPELEEGEAWHEIFSADNEARQPGHGVRNLPEGWHWACELIEGDADKTMFGNCAACKIYAFSVWLERGNFKYARHCALWFPEGHPVRQIMLRRLSESSI
jgi:hypothetical protein